MQKLPKSALTILKVIQENGDLTPKQIKTHVSFAERTISFALRILVNAGILRKYPHLGGDMRQSVYTLPELKNTCDNEKRDVETDLISQGSAHGSSQLVGAILERA
jgi:predicted transcriptional regulator